MNALQIRRVKMTTALTEASVHNDRTEVARLMKAADKSETFEPMFDYGGARLHVLDSMLATALRAPIKSGELYRALTGRMIVAL